LRLLDIGCGRGAVLLMAAQRLPRGRAVGVDIWSTKDKSGNAEQVTRQNAVLEGVADRVEIHTADMRQLPFEDGSFDVVVSSLAIHNVPGQQGRERAIHEIARVLKPGGRIALLDIAFTEHYVAWLRDAGMISIRRTWPARWFFPPLGIVHAAKPVGGG
jgi:ubiquinone/menaquinone biosynthesis C-methylase UbiE